MHAYTPFIHAVCMHIYDILMHTAVYTTVECIHTMYTVYPDMHVHMY